MAGLSAPVSQNKRQALKFEGWIIRFYFLNNGKYNILHFVDEKASFIQIVWLSKKEEKTLVLIFKISYFTMGGRIIVFYYFYRTKYDKIVLLGISAMYRPTDLFFVWGNFWSA